MKDDLEFIAKKDLIPHRYYHGHCRNAIIALWTGTKFVHIRHKFGGYLIDDINHPEDDDGFDLFYPTRIVDEM